MRWRNFVGYVGVAGFVLISIVIYYGLTKNLTLLEWIGLLSIIGAVIRGSMSILDNYYNMFPKMHKIEIEHTDYLIREFFDKPVMFGNIVYEKDEINRTCAMWMSETVDGFKQVSDHLKHKKYRDIWYAYLDGKYYDKEISDRIYAKVVQYQIIMRQKISNSDIALVISHSNEINKGEYSSKWINHLIFHDILKKIKFGDSHRILEIKPFYLNSQSHDYYLDWMDSGDAVLKATNIVAKGDVASLETLQKTITQIENDSEIIYLVLEIDSMRICLKNNPGLKLFDSWRKELINHLRNTKEILDGFSHIPHMSPVDFI